MGIHQHLLVTPASASIAAVLYRASNLAYDYSGFADYPEEYYEFGLAMEAQGPTCSVSSPVSGEQSIDIADTLYGAQATAEGTNPPGGSGPYAQGAFEIEVVSLDSVIQFGWAGGDMWRSDGGTGEGGPAVTFTVGDILACLTWYYYGTRWFKNGVNIGDTFASASGYAMVQAVV